MIFLIHSVEFILVLLIVALFFNVIRAYKTELPSSLFEVTSYNAEADLKPVSVVENYIEAFFPIESESLNPLLVLREEQELHDSANESFSTLENPRNVNEENSQSISSKVIEAMMSEAKLVCAS